VFAAGHNGQRPSHVSGVLGIGAMAGRPAVTGMGLGERFGQQVLRDRETAQELELVLAEARSLRWTSGALGSPFISQRLCYKQRAKASICFERESRNLPISGLNLVTERATMQGSAAGPQRSFRISGNPPSRRRLGAYQSSCQTLPRRNVATPRQRCLDCRRVTGSRIGYWSTQPSGWKNLRGYGARRFARLAFKSWRRREGR
jgi:hypothetical protein